MSSELRLGDVPEALEAEVLSASRLIREVQDFPDSGVLFQDIGPILADGSALADVVRALNHGVDFDVVAGVEARGFLLGAAAAHAAGTGVVGLRKAGKLPLVADRVDYSLEYGTASLELPAESLSPGQRVLVVDDVLATGGTLEAACQLVRRAGATVVLASVVLEITPLKGRKVLDGEPLRTLLAV